MTLRLIARSTQVQVHGYIHQARVYRDAEWNEYRVRIYLNGQLNAAADYHTSDKQDAQDTMQAYESNWLKAATKPAEVKMDSHARAVTLNAQANARGWHNTATGEIAVAESETDSGIAKAWRDSAKNAQHWSAYWSALALSHLCAE